MALSTLTAQVRCKNHSGKRISKKNDTQEVSYFAEERSSTSSISGFVFNITTKLNLYGLTKSPFNLLFHALL